MPSTPAEASKRMCAGIVDGPANHLKVALMRFRKEIGRDQVAPHGKLAGADLQGALQRIGKLPVVEQSRHQRGFYGAQPGEYRRFERDDDGAGNFGCFAQRADQRVLAAPEATGFQFQVKHNVVPVREFQNFAQGGNALSHEFTAKPGTGIHAAKLGQGQLLHNSLPGGGAIDRFVVDGNEVRVAGQVQVGLDKRNPQRDRATKRRERILRGIAGSTAVGNGKQEKSSGNNRANWRLANLVPVVC